MVSKVTLIVPTHKRYPCLLRFLKFYQSYNHDLTILILDSTQYDPANDELKELLSCKNTIWKKYDEILPLWDRIADGTKHVDTNYVALCADDDFIIPGALTECANFLSKNPDYSSADGLCFLHYFKEINGYYHSIEPLYEKHQSSSEKTGRERLEAYLSGKSHIPFYALHRTDMFRLIWAETSKYVSDWTFNELISCCLSVVYGKMKILPVFYASREPHAYIYNDHEMFKRDFSQNNVKKAIEGVGKHLSKVDGLSQEEGQRIVRGAFDVYIEKVEKKYLAFQSIKYDHALTLWTQIKQKLKIRTRFHRWFYEGCHPSIYPVFFEDYIKVKEAVLSAGITQNDLNVSRQEYAEKG